MTVDGGFLPCSKRRRYSSIDTMDSVAAKAKLAEMKEKFGREIRVFETVAAIPAQNPVETEEMDEFYEFTAEDYYRITASRKEDKFLKTKKIREAEEAARRSKLTKSIMRVRFPDNITLEATFHPSEKIQSLVDLLKKVLAQPGLPFYLYTTPPKKQIKDTSIDFYTAGFIPGAIVYFSYNVPKGGDDVPAAEMAPSLSEYVMALKGLNLEAITEQVSPPDPAPEPVQAAAPAPPPVAQERKPADKKVVKPKWLKM
ncbi:hypothetical protein SAY87_025720 [Trapa incisa]|uniref:UBX domain-containing protein n=1 Tax=Trapa incisa TaxID=236973 RepID=A0AAN7GKZ4_9MYRT|nr:hypothetical protein SAY87_025720 [Trapa incisa]